MSADAPELSETGSESRSRRRARGLTRGELASRVRGYRLKLHALGGVLMYGIPEFRLPKSWSKEIAGALKLGVKIENVIIGKSITVDEFFEEGLGCFHRLRRGLPSFMKIEGENLNGVYSANEFLTART